LAVSSMSRRSTCRSRSMAAARTVFSGPPSPARFPAGKKRLHLRLLTPGEPWPKFPQLLKNSPGKPMALDAETREQLISSVRRFVDERLRPIEDKVSETDKVPEEIVEEMKELGLFGISVPVEYGGLGLTMEEECLLMFELGRTSPAFRSV